MTLHVICVAYHRAIPLRILIDSFLVQTKPNWILHIVHDGPAPEDVKAVVALYTDPRIRYEETPVVNGRYGHPNRRDWLMKLPSNRIDYVLMTNDDNYYVPKFVEYMNKESRKDMIGFIFCDTLHSYCDYDVMVTTVKECRIDMGSFVVRLDVAKKVGFNHIHHSADGAYAVECANYCMQRRLRIVHINKPIFIHN